MQFNFQTNILFYNIKIIVFYKMHVYIYNLQPQMTIIIKILKIPIIQNAIEKILTRNIINVMEFFRINPP